MSSENQGIEENQEVALIKIGADYFRKCARREYSNPLPWIWTREALQNSIDADSSEIYIGVSDAVIELKDNGCGMDDKIIRDKLLVLGGTFKNTENATGGFGKAKEVLFFAWNKWSIESSPNRIEKYTVTSEMIAKQPIRREIGRYERGTTIRIEYDPTVDDKSSWIRNIKSFVAYCSTHCKIYLNGEQLETLPLRGSKIEYDLATIRVNKSKRVDRIYIRINGIPMFVRWIETGIPALVTVDLKGKSVEMLSSSRESLKWELQREFDKIVQRILINPKTIANKTEDTIFIDKYAAKEVIQIKETLTVQMTAAEYSPAEIEKIGNAIEACVSGEKTLIESVVEDIKDIDPEVAERLKLVVSGHYQSKMGYTYVVHRYKNKTPDIDPTGAKAQQLLHMWKRITEEVLRTRNISVDWIAGLTFDPNEVAAILKQGSGEVHFLINPTKVKQYADALGLGLYMFPSACHEITHLKHDNHDEYFTSALGDLLQIMSDNPRKWINLFNKAKAEAAKLRKESQ